MNPGNELPSGAVPDTMEEVPGQPVSNKTDSSSRQGLAAGWQDVALGRRRHRPPPHHPSQRCQSLHPIQSEQSLPNAKADGDSHSKCER